MHFNKKTFLTVGCWNVLIQRHSHDARVLYANNCLIGAVYLKGYAIECLLKKIITARYYALGTLPSAVQEKVERCFSSSVGHNLTVLLDMAFSDKDPRKKRLRIPVLQFAVSWSVDLRYSTKPMDTRAAAAILRLADRILALVSMEER